MKIVSTCVCRPVLYNDPLGEACLHLANAQKIIEAKNAEIERLKLTDEEREALKEISDWNDES